MYRFIPRFCFLITFSFVILSGYKLFALYKDNHIAINNINEYVKVLDDAHKNIDNYIGKQISVSGYTYIQDDFPKNRFVIAQNAYFDYSSEPYIVGFLCENATQTSIIPNQTISIIGKIVKGSYNQLEYPIIKVKKITLLHTCLLSHMDFQGFHLLY